MGASNVATLTVDQVTKYGFKSGNEYVSLSQKSGLKPENFVPGRSYELDLYVAPSGKKYVNRIVGPSNTSSAAVVAPQRIVEVKSAPIVNDAEANKRRDIQRQGLYQAALGSPVLGQWAMSFEEYLSLVRAAAEAGVSFVNEK